MVTFSHRDRGTSEAVWALARADHVLPDVVLSADALLVVAAHPDDETLGVGGLMHRAAALGMTIAVLSVTDGEGSHPDSPTHTPAQLAARRRIELRASVDELAPDVELTFLGVPDGGIRNHLALLERAVTGAIRSLREGGHRVLVLAPWTGDGHGDHRVTGEVVARVCEREEVALRTYPIWLWHWGTPDDVPWDAAEEVVLDDVELAAKRRALARHASQTVALSDEPGDEVMLHEWMQSHFLRSAEIVFIEPPRAGRSMGADWFDAFYARNDDPWGFDSRWYEERKRDLLLASLPARRYARGVELGCSTGALTEMLAERTDLLVAVDISDAALDRAAQRLSGAIGVEFVKATLPREWPAGRFDLIVLSEVGYYWSGADLEKAIRRIEESLTDDGILVACHWRHPVAEYPLTGDSVHIALRTMSSLAGVVRHEEKDFLLEVFAHPAAPSVAQRDGLVA
ncbi:PIG-L family deacetylase [Microbacterium sp.]|uniref:PIG-L family deacetylase n=1 Tax=Microbacterium sp. TaxID=51671 RepID=UPI003F709228